MNSSDYGATPSATSFPSRFLLWGVWGAMALSQLVYVLAFCHNQPLHDEWEFVPALCAPSTPVEFYWQQHNEHRLPLPRFLYAQLFRLTGDFRSGSILQVILLAAIAALGMKWAAELRGRPDWVDLFFPVCLLHIGHCENLMMGYQFCFALSCLFVMLLVRIAMTTTPENKFSQAWKAVIVSYLLALCGGSGFVFLPFVYLWIGVIIWKEVRKRPLASSLLAASIALLCLYVWYYFQNWHRPEGHPPFDPKNTLVSLQVSAEVVAVGFGIGVKNIWKYVFFGIAAVAVVVLFVAIRRAIREPAERPRIAGFIAIALGVTFLVGAIGAGRGGMGDDMGLWPRYAILSWPLLACLFYAAVACRVRWIPMALAIFGLIALYENSNQGCEWGRVADNWRETIAADARAGMSAEDITEKHIKGTGQEDRAIVGIPMLRAKGIGPFQP